MGKVPQHFRGQDPSRQTGAGSADQSGAIIAGAVQNLSDTFFKGVTALEARSKQLVNDSAKAKAIGAYSTEYLEGANQIKKDNIDNPEMATEKLKAFRGELKDRHSDALADQGIQQEFAFAADKINVQEDIRDVAYKIEQSSLISQQNYLDRIGNDAKTAAQTASYEDYINIIDKFQVEEVDLAAGSEGPESANPRGLSQAFGGIQQGQKVLEQGMESITRGFISGKLARGESFEAAQHLIRGDFDLFIEPDVKAELLKKVDQAQAGQVKQSNFLQAAEAAVDIFQTSKDVLSDDMDIVGLEEKISGISFSLATAKQQGFTEERISALTKQSALLERLRDIKLERIETLAVDDIDTKANLLSDYQFLVDFEEGKNSLTESLDKVLEFQRKATEAHYAGKISKGTFQKWMLFSETAINSDIKDGIKPKGFGLSKGFEAPFAGFGSTDSLSSSRKIRNRLKDILSNTDRGLGKQYAVDTLEFYMDSLTDQTGGDEESLNQLSDETHDNLLKNAKAKAALKKMGLPVYLTVGDNISVNNFAQTIVGFDKDGMPQIEVKE